MTLEALRPLLAYYDTAGAILRVLEFGPQTAAGLTAATGKGRRAVYAALAQLEAAQAVQKTAQGGVQNPALEYALSAKSCTEGVQNPALIPQASAENCTPPVQKTALETPVQKTAQPENTDPDSETGECKKLHTPSLISNSFKEENSLKNLTLNQLEGGVGETFLDDKALEEKPTPPSPPAKSKPKAPKYIPEGDPRVPAWVPTELWGQWCAARREMRKPLTATAVGRQCDDLTTWQGKYGLEAALGSLKNSIRNGWQGLFEPKGAIKPTATHQEREKWTAEDWTKIPDKKPEEKVWA